MRPPYVSKRSPRVKQAEALSLLVGREAFALLMAMRTGKSKVVADDFGRLYSADQVDDLLIIAPGGVYKTWANLDSGELRGALSEDWPAWMIEAAKVHVWESGTYNSAKRKAELSRFLQPSNGPRVLIINIEALSAVELARQTVLKFCKARRTYAAVDESTIIKNPTAKRAKFVVKEVAPLLEVRRILSGLITPRSPLDLYAQYAFLDKAILGHKSYKSFEARYAIKRAMEMGGRRFDIVVGFRHTEELHSLISPHSFRVRLEDCYDMPASSYAFLDVPLTDEQKRIYREMKEYAVSELAREAYVSSTNVITQILRLHQVLCGHTTDEEGNEHLIPELRTRTLLDYLEGYDGKAIIWCSYDYNVKAITDALTKEYGEGSVARFWGGNRSTRESEERDFKTKPECRFMVATPDAGGWGRTWDCANLVIYFSSKNNLEHRGQSEERPKGVGKETPIAYIDMRAPGTVEENIVQALRDKIDMSTAINGDNYREWLI